MASDMYLKLTGIEGESTDDKHKGEIEVIAFSTGVSMAVGPRSTAGSATTERASLADLSIQKKVDSATPLLFKAACSGTHIAEAILSINRAAGDNKVEYLKYTLTDVVVANYSTGGGGDLADESISLNYAKLKVEYVPTDNTGAGKGAKAATWDVALNKAV